MKSLIYIEKPKTKFSDRKKSKYQHGGPQRRAKWARDPRVIESREVESASPWLGVSLDYTLSGYTRRLFMKTRAYKGITTFGLALFSLFVFGAGCVASGRIFTNIPKPQTGQRGTLIIYREQPFVAVNVSFDVTIDGTQCATIGPNDRIELELASGMHSISVGFASITLNIETESKTILAYYVGNSGTQLSKTNKRRIR